MRALRFHEFGNFDNLTVEDLPDPSPSRGEVVVEIQAASLNPSDAKNVLGRMSATTLPRTPGRDFAGIVVGGPPEFVGQEVWGTGGDVGFTRDGTHAERVVVPAAGIRVKPKTLTFEQAASAGVNFVTAWIGLIEAAHVRAGETVLATGAAGGVGSAVMQLAKWKGARTIGVNLSPMSERQQQEYGIDHVLLAGAGAQYREMVAGAMRLTGNEGVDVAYDCVGGPLFEPCLQTLAHRGRQVNITSVGERRVSFDLIDFYRRHLTLFGVDSLAYDTERSAGILEQLAPGFESGALKPLPVVKRFTLDEARQAYRDVDSGKVRGKAVFIFDGGNQNGR